MNKLKVIWSDFSFLCSPSGPIQQHFYDFLTLLWCDLTPYTKFRKISIVSPGLIFVQKTLSAALSFEGAYFRKGLLLEGILRFKMGWN